MAWKFHELLKALKKKFLDDKVHYDMIFVEFIYMFS
jgi:hypothetical protein